MNKRIAKKVLCDPGRYSRGQIRTAESRYGCVGMIDAFANMRAITDGLAGFVESLGPVVAAFERGALVAQDFARQVPADMLAPIGNAPCVVIPKQIADEWERQRAEVCAAGGIPAAELVTRHVHVEGPLLHLGQPDRNGKP
jgi:hypothetical protein